MFNRFVKLKNQFNSQRMKSNSKNSKFKNELNDIAVDSLVTILIKEKFNIYEQRVGKILKDVESSNKAINSELIDRIDSLERQNKEFRSQISAIYSRISTNNVNNTNLFSTNDKKSNLTKVSNDHFLDFIERVESLETSLQKYQQYTGSDFDTFSDILNSEEDFFDISMSGRIKRIEGVVRLLVDERKNNNQYFEIEENNNNSNKNPDNAFSAFKTHPQKPKSQDGPRPKKHIIGNNLQSVTLNSGNQNKTVWPGKNILRDFKSDISEVQDTVLRINREGYRRILEMAEIRKIYDEKCDDLENKIARLSKHINHNSDHHPSSPTGTVSSRYHQNQNIESNIYQSLIVGSPEETVLNNNSNGGRNVQVNELKMQKFEDLLSQMHTIKEIRSGQEDCNAEIKNCSMQASYLKKKIDEIMTDYCIADNLKIGDLDTRINAVVKSISALETSFQSQISSINQKKINAVAEFPEVLTKAITSRIDNEASKISSLQTDLQVLSRSFVSIEAKISQQQNFKLISGIDAIESNNNNNINNSQKELNAKVDLEIIRINSLNDKIDEVFRSLAVYAKDESGVGEAYARDITLKIDRESSRIGGLQSDMLALSKALADTESQIQNVRRIMAADAEAEAAKPPDRTKEIISKIESELSQLAISKNELLTSTKAMSFKFDVETEKMKSVQSDIFDLSNACSNLENKIDDIKGSQLNLKHNIGGALDNLNKEVISNLGKESLRIKKIEDCIEKILSASTPEHTNNVSSINNSNKSPANSNSNKANSNNGNDDRRLIDVEPDYEPKAGGAVSGLNGNIVQSNKAQQIIQSASQVQHRPSVIAAGTSLQMKLNSSAVSDYSQLTPSFETQKYVRDYSNKSFETASGIDNGMNIGSNELDNDIGSESDGESLRSMQSLQSRSTRGFDLDDSSFIDGNESLDGDYQSSPEKNTPLALALAAANGNTRAEGRRSSNRGGAMSTVSENSVDDASTVGDNDNDNEAVSNKVKVANMRESINEIESKLTVAKLQRSNSKGNIKKWIESFEETNKRSPTFAENLKAHDKISNLRSTLDGLKSELGNLAGQSRSSKESLSSKSINSGNDIRDATDTKLSTPKLKEEDSRSVFPERSFEVLELTKKINEEKQKLSQAEKTKSTSKKVLKAWIANFQLENGRPPTNNDMAAAQDLFQDHAKAQQNISSISDNLKILEDQLDMKIDIQTAAIIPQELSHKTSEASITVSQKTLHQSPTPPLVSKSAENTSSGRSNRDSSNILSANTSSKSLAEKVAENSNQAPSNKIVTDINILKSQIAEEENKLLESEKDRNEKKKSLKTWISAFQKKHGRIPDKTDRERAKNLFSNYKEAQILSSKITTVLKTLQSRLHELDNSFVVPVDVGYENTDSGTWSDGGSMKSVMSQQDNTSSTKGTGNEGGSSRPITPFSSRPAILFPASTVISQTIEPLDPEEMQRVKELITKTEISLKEADSDKVRTKKAIKSWTDDFSQINGRLPSSEDKETATARKLFEDHAKAQSDVTALMVSLKSLQLKANIRRGSVLGSRPNSPRALTPVTANNPIVPAVALNSKLEVLEDSTISNTNNNIQNIKASVAVEEAKLEAATKEKSKFKKEIKVWISDFKSKNGREPNNNDKEAILGLFEAHAQASQEISAISFVLVDLKADLVKAEENKSISTTGIEPTNFNKTIDSNSVQKSDLKSVGIPSPLPEISSSVSPIKPKENAVEMDGGFDTGTDNDKSNHLKSEIQKLEVIVNQCGIEKSKTKKTIKEWTAKFARENQREPAAKDKESVKDLFIEHKKASVAKDKAEENLQKLKDELARIQIP